MMNFCGEIQYENEMGTVHSDICLHSKEGVVTEDYRKFLHDCLNEWLDKSNGTGAFWIGNAMVRIK